MLGKFFKKTSYASISVKTSSESDEEKMEHNIKVRQPAIPNGMWVKCKACDNMNYKEDLEESGLICKHCGYHFRMDAKTRMRWVVDDGSFEEYDASITSANPIDFPGYEEKVKRTMEKTGYNEAVITGRARIDGVDCVIAVMDSSFMMGSMGSGVGEKITRAIENATQLRLPLIIFTASGGARMQEGIFSLMQMAKTSAALGKHAKSNLLYLTVLTDPTTGGVTASYAMLGDIILAEPQALVGFAGPRVIEQTIKQKLPDGFQKAEFLLEHGFVDKIVNRKELKHTLGRILSFHREVS